MTATAIWTCRVVNCSNEATSGWGSDIFPPVEVCAEHLDELARGALAIHTDGGESLMVKPLSRGTI